MASAPLVWRLAADKGIAYSALTMKTFAYIALIVPLALSACGVPDLVATGVKAYEKNQDQKDAAAQSASQQQVPQPQYQYQSQQSADPPPIVPPPRRDSVTVEPLR